MTARLENGERALCRRGAPWALPAGDRGGPFGLAGAGAQAAPPQRTDGCRTRVGLSHELSRCGRLPCVRGSVLLERTAASLLAWGPQREKTPRFTPGLGTAPGGSRGRSALLNRRCGGAARGGGGGSAPLGWRERRWLRRGGSRHFQEDGATYGKHLEFTGPAGTRREVQRFRAAPSGRGRAVPAAPGRGRGASEGAWPPRSSVPTAPGRMCGSVPGQRRDQTQDGR